MKKARVYIRPEGEEFSETLSFQESLLSRRVDNRDEPDEIVCVEHDHVYTLGRGSPPQLVTDAEKRKVKWIEISRGGEATYHGPGQLVVYPVLDLEDHGKDVHRYLRDLEEAVIKCLSKFDISAYRREGLTGVWVDTSAGLSKKLCSIGVGVRKWISYHGLALNVSSDLSYFRAISACGQNGEVMTSLAEILPDEAPTIEEIRSHLLEALSDVFSLELDFREGSRPSWIRAKAPGSPPFKETLDIVKEHKLVTVCEEAHCPNIGECWAHHTATFMIMGELCTRRCSFCAVKDGTLQELGDLDSLEPFRVAQAVKLLGLEHVVITSVNRDDLEDMGAEHFHRTVKAIRTQNPDTAVELLIPDMRGNVDLVKQLLRSGFVSVLNHNVETVPRLYKTVRPGARFERSLEILKAAKAFMPTVRTKSGLMVGLGETRDEVLELMDALRSAGCDIMTIGQYLRPTDKQLPVKRFVTPTEFEHYRTEGLKKGFLHVESGPLVRSSYHAWQHADSANKKSAEAA